MANGGKYAIGEILSWRNHTSILLASSQPVLASTYIWYCLKETSQMHATFTSARYPNAHLSRFSPPVNQNKWRQQKQQVYRQIYPQADFIRETSLDIDSTSYKGLNSVCFKSLIV